MSNMKKIIRVLSLLAGFLLVGEALVISLITGFSLTNLLVLCAGMGLLALFLLLKFFPDGMLSKFAVWCTCAGALYFTVMVAFILLSSGATVDYNEDSVIILGAGIKGEQMLPTLKMRLDKGIEYLNKNPKAVVVVSGGQGRGEFISEAEAMKRYLLSKDIAPNRILKEDKSTNTYENLEFSKKILDNMFSAPYTTVCISSRSHIYRALKIGKKQDFYLKALPAGVPMYLWPPVYLRETLAIPYAALKGRI